MKSFLTHFCLLIFNIQHFCSCVSIFFHPQHLIICFIPCQHQIVLKDSCMNMIRCIFSLICRPSIHFLNGVGWRYACQWQQAGPSRPQRRNPLRMGRVLWRPESRSGALWERLCASLLPVLHCYITSLLIKCCPQHSNNDTQIKPWQYINNHMFPWYMFTHVIHYWYSNIMVFIE